MLSEVLPITLIHEESSATISSLVIVTQAFTPEHLDLFPYEKTSCFFVVVVFLFGLVVYFPRETC